MDSISLRANVSLIAIPWQSSIAVAPGDCSSSLRPLPCKSWLCWHLLLTPDGVELDTGVGLATPGGTEGMRTAVLSRTAVGVARFCCTDGGLIAVGGGMYDPSRC